MYRLPQSKLSHKILCMQHSNSQKAKIYIETLGKIIKEERLK